MRWQRPVRILVALVGVGCAIAIVVYSRKRPAPTATPAALTDPKVTSQQSGVLNLRTNVNTGKEDLRIEAQVSTAFEDGRTRLSRAHFTSTRNDGTTFDIWSDVAESQGKAVTGDEPGLIQLHGHVRTKASDGLEVETDDATYDNVQGLATIPGKLTFRRDRMKGSGVGATYDRQRDVLWLLDEARVARLPDAKGEGALEASAKGIGVARADKFMNLRDHARVVQPDQTLAADQLIIHFTDDDKGAKLIEMHGNASVIPGAAAKPDAPNLQADEMALEFQADGQTLRHATLNGKSRLVQTTDQGRQTISALTIDLVTGSDGRTLTNLQAQTGVEVLLPGSGENPDRTIHATSLVTSGDEKNGLNAAIFDGDVTFVEKSAAAPAPRGGRGAAVAPAVDRTGTSKSLTLDLKGQLGAIQKSEFRQNVSFKDGNMRAGADSAVHDEAAGTLVLTPAKGAKSGPWVDDGSVRVDALWIQVELANHNLRAKDKVTTKMTPGKSTEGDTKTPALFEPGQPVYGTGAALKYVNATKSATFVGQDAANPARVYQSDGRNTIAAVERIDVEQDTGNLHALGQVKSSFELDDPSNDAPRGNPAPSKAPPSARGPNTPAKPSKTVVSAKEMNYVDANRQAVYLGEAGKPVALTGPDGDVEAQQITLTLAKDERALKTLDASGTMAAKFEGGRETIGDRLQYDPATETHVITGKPMYFKNVQIDSGKKSCSLETSTELHYQGKDQTIEEPPSEPKALRTSKQMPCEEPLKTSVAKLKAAR